MRYLDILREGVLDTDVAGTDLTKLDVSEKVTAAINTPEFASFFKGSKVVDDSGNPLVCWHASKGGKEALLNLYGGSHFGSAELVNDFKNVYTNAVGYYFLNIKNPLEVEDEGNHTLNYYIDLLLKREICKVDDLQFLVARAYKDWIRGEEDEYDILNPNALVKYVVGALKNPYIADEATSEIVKNGSVDLEEAMEILDVFLEWLDDGEVAGNSSASGYFQIIGRLLQSAGIDGLVYENKIEGLVGGDNMCWVPVSNSQIKLVDSFLK